LRGFEMNTTPNPLLSEIIVRLPDKGNNEFIAI